MSIIDFGRFGPALDETVFPSTPLDTFWTSSSYDTEMAWQVSMDMGRLEYLYKDFGALVRCVRREPGGVSNRYERTEPMPGEPVVADTVTGLVWQGCRRPGRGYIRLCGSGAAAGRGGLAGGRRRVLRRARVGRVLGLAAPRYQGPRLPLRLENGGYRHRPLRVPCNSPRLVLVIDPICPTPRLPLVLRLRRRPRQSGRSLLRSCAALRPVNRARIIEWTYRF